MMKPLQLKCQMLPSTRRMDGSVTIKLVTAEEVSTVEFAEIDSHRQQTGWFLFSANKFDPRDVPKDDVKIEGESMSQRQRRILFKLFIAQGGNPEEFPTFYEEQMTKIYNLLVDKIKMAERVKDKEY